MTLNPEGLLAIYGYPLKDPAANCHVCGAIGTVGRAIRKLDERETFHVQYCAACWPTESKRLMAQWDAAMNAWFTDAMHSTDRIAPNPLSHEQSAMGAATWDGAEAFLREHLLPAQQSASPRSRAELEAIAAQYVQLEKEYVGAMPPLVADFIQQCVAPPRSTEPVAAT